MPVDAACCNLSLTKLLFLLPYCMFVHKGVAVEVGAIPYSTALYNQGA